MELSVVNWVPLSIHLWFLVLGCSLQVVDDRLACRLLETWLLDLPRFDGKVVLWTHLHWTLHIRTWILLHFLVHLNVVELVCNTLGSIVRCLEMDLGPVWSFESRTLNALVDTQELRQIRRMQGVKARRDFCLECFLSLECLHLLLFRVQLSVV
jgi:hypothetical protein